jgi:hypothetical protein
MICFNRAQTVHNFSMLSYDILASVKIQIVVIRIITQCFLDNYQHLEYLFYPEDRRKVCTHVWNSEMCIKFCFVEL